MLTRHCTALFLVCFCVAAVSLSSATSKCAPPAPRAIGVFGAMDKPPEPVQIAAFVRSQLPANAVVRDVFQTSLTPEGEQVILYDATPGAEVPNPKVSVIRDGTVKATFDIGSFVKYGADGVYMSGCEFDLTPTQKALAAAVGADRARHGRDGRHVFHPCSRGRHHIQSTLAHG